MSNVYDFLDEESVSGWESVNDVVMGGCSEGQVSWCPEGHLAFAGNLSFENNGGFASVRSPLLEGGLGRSEGIVLKVRGDGRSYTFSVRTDSGFDGVSFQALFSAEPGEWQEVRLPFAKFVPTHHGRVLSTAPPEATDVRRLGLLIADRQEGPFRLEVSSIGIY